MIQQLGIFQLPQCLVDRNGHGIAQIQASRFFSHRDPDAIFKVVIQKILWKTFGLLAEKQVAAIGEFYIRITPGRFGGKAPKFLDIVFGKKVIQVIIDPHIHKMPVVQSCPADSFFGNVKTQGADQMQHSAGGGTGAGNVTAVLGDFRFMQYDIQQNLSPQKSERWVYPRHSPPYCSAKEL